MANVVKYILDLNTKKAQRGLEKAGRETKDLGKDLKKTKRSGLEMASQIGSAVTGMAAGIGLTVGAFRTLTGVVQDATRAAFDLNKSVVDNINDLNDLNAQSALTAQSIQAVEQAFVGSGQSAGAAAAFISRFPRLMADLEAGAGRASEAAQKLGIEFKDSAGNMKDADDILKQSISRLQAMENDTERTTTAFLLFGRSAGQLLQAFGKTAEFEKFLEFSSEFGTKTGPEASAAAARFQELLSALEITTKGTKQAFVQAIGGIDFFNGILLESIKILVTLQTTFEENDKEISNLSNSLVKIAKDFFLTIKSLVTSFQDSIAEVGNFVVFSVTKMLSPVILLIMALEELGMVQAGTVAQFDNLGMSVQKANIDLEKAVIGVNESMNQNQDRAEKAGSMIEDILKGLNTESESFKNEMEALEKAMQDAKGSAKELNDELFSFGGTNELEATRLQEAISTVTSAIGEFKPLSKAFTDAQEQTTALAHALVEFTNNGIDTTEVAELLGIAIEKQGEAMDALNGKTEKATMSIGQLGDQIAGIINDISDPTSVVSSLSGITEIIGSSLSGLNIQGGLGFGQMAASKAGSALTTAAPIVGAIAQVVTALEKLGKETPKSLKKQFDDFVKNFKKGAELLPTLIADILPSFVAQLLVAIVEAGITLSFQLTRAIRDGLFEFIFELTKQIGEALFGWLDRVKAFFADIGDFFANIFSSEGRKENRKNILGFESGGRFVPDVGMSFTGEGFADEGMAMLHRGETVVPESNRRSQAVDRTMNSMGGGVTVVVNADIVESSAIDELVRRIEERFQGFGGARSTLFGV